MGQGHKDISEQYILQEVDSSLQRLGVDYIDLYFTHWDDNKTPVDETLGAYDKLIQAGKVRWIGASNLSPERLQASLDAHENKGLPKYEVFQPEYNLYDRQHFEQGVGPICTENNIGVICYYSLASGFWSGKYRSEKDLGKSVRGGGVKKYLNERGMGILDALDAISAKHNSTPSSVALAWLMHKPAVTAPIASATKERHVQSFANAASLKLDEGDMQQLDNASGY
jgi:aryl-alcohol dehydrogenase-like predicted oxidoreductase